MEVALHDFKEVVEFPSCTPDLNSNVEKPEPNSNVEKPQLNSIVEKPDLTAIVEQIRDRREAMLEGTIPPKLPRQILISIDEEEVRAYRIEITTDNAEQRRRIPPHFSQSEAEEYLAEFDYVQNESVHDDYVAKLETVKQEGDVKDDDTKSLTTQSTESFRESSSIIRQVSFPKRSPGAMERFIDNVLDRVACQCVRTCGDGAEEEGETVHKFMAKKIQIIKQKAQMKKDQKITSKMKKKKKKEITIAPRVFPPTQKERSRSLKTAEKGKGGIRVEEKKKKEASTVVGEAHEKEPSSTPSPSLDFTVGDFYHRKQSRLYERELAKVQNEEESKAGSVKDMPKTIKCRSQRNSVEETPKKTDGTSLKVVPLGLGKPKGTIPSAAQRKHDEDDEDSHQSESKESVSISLLQQAQICTIFMHERSDDDDASTLLDDDSDSEYTTELVEVDFDPTKLANATDADMYLAREVLRRYAEMTGVSLDELIEDVVDESLASITLSISPIEI